MGWPCRGATVASVQCELQWWKTERKAKKNILINKRISFNTCLSSCATLVQRQYNNNNEFVWRWMWGVIMSCVDKSGPMNTSHFSVKRNVASRFTKNNQCSWPCDRVENWPTKWNEYSFLYRKETELHATTFVNDLTKKNNRKEGQGLFDNLVYSISVSELTTTIFKVIIVLSENL